MKNILKIALFCASFGFAAPALAQNFTWNRVNIGGGGMNTGILVHPANSDLIYVRQDVSGLLRWNPTAKKWEQLLDWMPMNWWNAKGCSGFAVDTTAGADIKRQDTLYAALGNWQNSTQASAQGNGIFRSFDRGTTWSKIWSGTTLKMGNYEVWSFASNSATRTAGENLAVDPFNPDVLWAGTQNDGLWQSFNARADEPAFSKVDSAPKGYWNNPFEGVGIREILIDPRGGSVGEGAQKRAKIVFLGLPKSSKIKTLPEGTQTGVFRSDDGGATWKLLDGANAPDSPWRMALGPQSGQILVSNRSGDDNKGLRFFDGEKWMKAPGTETTGFGGLVTAPNGLVVAGGAPNATWISRDWGQTWIQKSDGKGAKFEPTNWNVKEKFYYPNAPVYALDPQNPTRIWFGDSFGVHHTENILADTVKWTPWLDGYETTVGWAVSSPPVGPRLYYACADVNGFVWDDDPSKTPQDQLFQGVYKDDNGGKGAQATWGINDSAVSDIEWAPSKPENQIVLRSTWKGYYSPYARIYRTLDAGKTWKGFDAPTHNPATTSEAAKAAGAAKIAISSTDPNRMVYVRAMSFPVYSENGFSGDSIEWKPSSGVQSMFRDVFPYYVAAMQLQADAADGMRFYYSVRAEKTGKWEIYVSDDGGATWQLPTTQKLPNFPRDVTLASLKNADGKGEIYASGMGNGLYVSRDGARTFEKVLPGKITFARGVAVGKPAPNSPNPTLYLAGTLEKRDGVFYSSDFGQNWTPMTAPQMPLVGGASVTDMAADGRDWGRVYIATGGTGAFYSTAK